MYLRSRGNDVFPLIAAFGALWARGFLRRAMQASGMLAAADLDRGARAARWRRLNDFAEAFRHLHQRVFTETSMLQCLISTPALVSLAAQVLPGELLAALRHADAAAHESESTSEAERAALFDALFRWEQEQAVGTRVIDAFAGVDWPLVTAVARRPIVRFGYFTGATTLRFIDFTSMEERILHGRRAYEIAADAGWPAVTECLDIALNNKDWAPAAARAAACPLAGWLTPTPSATAR